MTTLPYPHYRKDCVMCRERDADFHVLGAEWNQPGKRPARVCRACMGPFLVTVALHSRPGGVGPGEPVTLRYEMLPPREDAWDGRP